MAEPKTKPTGDSVAAFLNKVTDPQRREDCFTVLKMMEEATKARATMWGSAIVGFGSRHYEYASGREGDWPLIAFSPRKANLTLYVGSNFPNFDELTAKLGKHKMSGSCLHINRLADVHMPTLKKVIQASVKKAKTSA